MRLVPYSQRARRLEKVVRHYYRPSERWWEVTAPTLPEWTAEWNTLRSAGALLQAEGWHLIEPETMEDALCREAHSRWLSAAERACDEARARQTVFPGQTPERICYVGEGGVTVYVAVGRLVTCFRVLDAGAQRSGKKIVQLSGERHDTRH
ncbi:MAG: hypothetical protein ACI8S6_001122 [Myxococcota bacterium]|jgi:hypothetical protein